MSEILIKGHHWDIIIPGRVHIPAEDGGHLVIKPHTKVPESIFLPFNEASELIVLQNIARETLYAAFNTKANGYIGMFNYQENGNWSAHKNHEDRHAHVHVYGRATEAKTQSYGKALNFSRFEQDDKDNKFEGYPYSQRDIESLEFGARMTLYKGYLFPFDGSFSQRSYADMNRHLYDKIRAANPAPGPS